MVVCPNEMTDSQEGATKHLRRVDRNIRNKMGKGKNKILSQRLRSKTIRDKNIEFLVVLMCHHLCAVLHKGIGI